jgi:general nucleoside transport system ATP-binding protein
MKRSSSYVSITERRRPPDGAQMLAARSITRRFGRVVALDAVDFDAHPSEIHALLGENGAGKTTLTNILAGRLRPDEGWVTLFGRALRASSPAEALKAGVAAVHQSPLLFERMTWEENLALGSFGSASPGLNPGYRVDLAKVASKAADMARELGFAVPPPRTRIERCSMGERVRLEMLRALSFEPRVLILDEPTVLLAAAELTAFLGVLRRLRTEGRIVILVTHKLDEALAVADRITVLRRGHVAARRMAGEVDRDELARLMIGELAPMPDRHRGPSEHPKIALRIEDLIVEVDGRRAIDHLSLTVHSGEIVGIAGVDGNGQAELIEALAGARRAVSGSIQVMAEAEDEREKAMAVVPENRDLDGLALGMPLWENLLLARPLLSRFAGRTGWLGVPRAIAFCAELIARFRIRATGPQARAAELSGGNRQRLCVARALASAPSVLVAHNLTRGLDLAAAAEVRRLVTGFAASGGSVLLVSNDLDELLALCGRLAVISRGHLRAVDTEERDPAMLGLLMAGAT